MDLKQSKVSTFHETASNIYIINLTQVYYKRKSSELKLSEWANEKVWQKDISIRLLTNRQKMTNDVQPLESSRVQSNFSHNLPEKDEKLCESMESLNQKPKSLNDQT